MERKKLAILSLALVVLGGLAAFSTKGVGGDPRQQQFRSLAAQMYQLHDKREFSKAADVARKRVTMAGEAFGKESTQYAEAVHDLGFIYNAAGDYPRAEKFIQAALTLDRKVHGHEHPSIAKELDNLAWVYRNQGRFHEALDISLSSLAMYEKLNGERHPDVVIALNNVSLAYQGLRQCEDGRQAAERAYQLIHSASKPHPDLLALSANNLALHTLCLKRFPEAEKLLKEALKVGGQQKPTNLVAVLENLGVVYLRTNRKREAVATLQRGLVLAQKTYGKDHPISRRIDVLVKGAFNGSSTANTRQPSPQRG